MQCPVERIKLLVKGFVVDKSESYTYENTVTINHRSFLYVSENASPMIKHISYEENPMDGVIKHLQNYTNQVDIVDISHLASIVVPSIRSTSYERSSLPKVVFGIDNQNYEKYWCTENNVQAKYIFFALKFPISIEGIGITNNFVDWLSNYDIMCSNDNMA